VKKRKCVGLCREKNIKVYFDGTATDFLNAVTAKGLSVGDILDVNCNDTSLDIKDLLWKVEIIKSKQKEIDVSHLL